MGFHDWPSLIFIPLWVMGSHVEQWETITERHGKRKNIFPMAKEKLHLNTEWKEGFALGILKPFVNGQHYQVIVHAALYVA